MPNKSFLLNLRVPAHSVWATMRHLSLAVNHLVSEKTEHFCFCCNFIKLTSSSIFAVLSLTDLAVNL